MFLCAMFIVGDELSISYTYVLLPSVHDSSKHISNYGLLISSKHISNYGLLLTFPATQLDITAVQS